ncbi:MAG TPA: D-aminoacylase [Rhizomicrobium sp.]|jgi:N-acyl-D-amino-acid deacylase|nr:D-aminoacylase [Rhizomicrobium sp.]
MRSAPLAVAAVVAAAALATSAAAPAQRYDVLIAQGTIYDGSGSAPFVGDVAIKGDRIVYVGSHAPGTAARLIDASGKAVSPGFINMLSQAQEALLFDGRGQSDLRQGVTLEVMGEGESMGPVNRTMKKLGEQREIDVKYKIDWATLGQYLGKIEKQGISPNVASFVGAATPRIYVLGERDVQPTAEQLAAMQALVHQAMEEGAMGVASALIYAPGTYAKTPEIIALASEAAKCGGMYISHMRNEGNHVLDGVDELIEISEKSGAPAEIYHMKVAGKPNWSKLSPMIAKIEAARAAGHRITANMYVYEAGATGLDAAMPPWVQNGGLEAWIGRLKDPAIRKRVATEMRNPNTAWDNLYALAGPHGTLMLSFKNPKLKPLTGKRLDEIAAMRHESPEDAAIDLVIEDGSRVGVAYFLMSDDNIKREIALPYTSFDSDESAQAPEGVFLKSSTHPRAYGNFARVLAKYVRDEKVIPLEAAIHKLTELPASNLSLRDRGLLKVGDYADVVMFDPATIQDHATYDHPQVFASGVGEVFVNGVEALRNGEPTGAHSGRFVRGRAWAGWPDGGCRKSAADWQWAKN